MRSLDYENGYTAGHNDQERNTEQSILIAIAVLVALMLAHHLIGVEPIVSPYDVDLVFTVYGAVYLLRRRKKYEKADLPTGTRPGGSRPGRREETRKGF